MYKRQVKSLPLLGWQVPIVTDENHEKGRILNINNETIYHHFKSNDVIVLTGFQGISVNGDITSLGRGGSDTTAVAIASSLNAARCDIYTDVEGVYTADPNVEKNAKKINKVSYEEMLEMSSMGAKVLQTRSVELAMKNNLTLQVLSSLTNTEGTYIVNDNKLIEKEIVSGVSYSNKTLGRDILKIKEGLAFVVNKKINPSSYGVLDGKNYLRIFHNGSGMEFHDLQLSLIHI